MKERVSPKYGSPSIGSVIEAAHENELRLAVP